MAEFYTNLPQQDQQALDKTIDQLQNKAYQDEYEFNAGEYDAAIAFFVKPVQATGQPGPSNGFWGCPCDTRLKKL